MTLHRCISRLFPIAAAAFLACGDDDPTGNAGAIELSVSPGAVSAAQGVTAAVTVSLTRSAGFATTVSLAASGLPAGVTTTITPEDLVGADASAVIEMAVGSTVPAGIYTGTATASADGAGDASVSWQLTVTAAGTVQYQFCDPSAVPVFAAFQDGNGAWQRVTGNTTTTGATFHVTFTQAHGGVLFVYHEEDALRRTARFQASVFSVRSPVSRLPSRVSQLTSRRAGQYYTDVLFGSVAELAQAATTTCAESPPTTSVTTTVNGVPAGQYGIISVGGITSILDGAVPPNQLTFEGVPVGLVDIVGTRATPLAAPDKMIVQRGLDLDASLPAIDFNGNAAVTPAVATATITGGGGDQLEMFTDVMLGDILHGLWSELARTTSTNRIWAGLPQSAMHSNDFHGLYVFASDEASPDFRYTLRYVGAVSNQSLALGPAMPDVVSSSLATGAYPRFRLQGTLPSEYSKGVSADFFASDGSGNGLIMIATAAWLAARGSGSAYDLAMPDVAGLTGFPADARLTAGENVMTVTGFGFTGAGVFDLKPMIGQEHKAGVKTTVLAVP